MVNDQNISSKGINNSDIRDLDLTLSFNKDEYEFMKAMTSLLAKMDMDDKGHTAIKEDNLTEFIRYCITVTGAITRGNIFIYDQMITRLPNKESKREFVAFREKYMNMPKEMQMDNLKKLGIVKAKK